MHIAQQVRIWVAVGVSALMGLGVFMVDYFAQTPLYNDPSSNLNVYNINALQDWIGLTTLMLVANAVLGGFIIYRMFRPLPPDHKAPVSVTVTRNKGETHE